MGVFKSTKTFYAPQSLIPVIARNIGASFSADGYQVNAQDLISGGYDISITKGGMFKAVLGMKTALKVNIMPISDGIRINAGVGIFGQQAIPTIISMLIFWPVLITQIAGLITQAQMDNKVMDIAAETIAREAYGAGQSHVAPSNYGVRADDVKFCTSCGKRLDSEAIFCSGCGNRL